MRRPLIILFIITLFSLGAPFTLHLSPLQAGDFGRMYKAQPRYTIYSTADPSLLPYREGRGRQLPPKFIFVSTSTIHPTTSYRKLEALNEDGSIPHPYQSTPSQPRRGRGLDTGDDDEPIGGLVPVGDTPFAFLTCLAFLWFAYRKYKHTTFNH